MGLSVGFANLIVPPRLKHLIYPRTWPYSSQKDSTQITGLTTDAVPANHANASASLAFHPLMMMMQTRRLLNDLWRYMLTHRIRHPTCNYSAGPTKSSTTNKGHTCMCGMYQSIQGHGTPRQRCAGQRQGWTDRALTGGSGCTWVCVERQNPVRSISLQGVKGGSR